MEIVFTVNQKEYKINPATVPIETSLNTFLRSHLRLTGTKFMCLEGGCGVCVVNISGIKTPTGEMRTFAVNSCLWPVYSCDGLNVTTVEGIGNVKDGYHAIQKALWHFNGTQCGYCSPGMVMNMYSLLETNNGKVTMNQVENSFGGNTCRCTGYRPILDAFKSFATDACIDIDIEDLTLDLCKLKDMNGVSACRNQCNKKCSLRPTTMEFMDDEGKLWIKPANATELFKALMMKTINTEYMLVAGNTAHGVYRRSRNIKVFIDIRNITELHVITVNETEMVFGGNVTLTDMMNALQMAAKKYNYYSYAEQMAKHIDLVANVPVRSAGSIAGNLSIKHAHHEFPSDIFLILEAIGAQMNIASIDGTCRTHSLKDYLALDMRQKLIVNIILPKLPPDQFLFRSYKVMPRSQNAHAMINAAFLFEFDKEMAVKSCRICYGGVTPTFIHAEATEKLLIGVKDLFTNEILQNVIKSFKNEIQPDSMLPDPSPAYRQSLAIGLFYRFLLENSPSERINDRFKSGAMGLERPLSSGSQAFESDKKLYPLTQAVPKYDGLIQVAGEAQYANDHFSSFRFDQELWAAFVPCTNVHSKMVSINAGKALKLAGVHSFLSAKHIPGINSFMPANCNLFGIVEMEELFLSMDSEVLFYGQPCGMILAKTMNIALAAADLVEIGYEKLNSKEIIPCLSHWLERNENVPLKDSITEIFPPTIDPSKRFVQVGNQKKIEGDFEIGAQYHYTMENQTTLCYPNDDGGLDVYCATQCLNVPQVAIAKLLNIQQSKVSVYVKRIGGGYGGKITPCASPACAAALGAFLTRQPVRFVLTIESNMRTMGKRYACAFNYDMNIDSVTGHISNINATLTEDFGYTLNDDVSFFTMDSFNRTCYARTDAWKITVNKVKTDAPSSTWCRAPGALEGITFLETIMEQIAREIDLDPAQVRLNNLPNDSTLKKYFPEFLKDTEYYERKSKINEFNKQNRWHKKGIAVAIMHYPIAYFSAFPTYVAIYHSDGTVAVSHGGIEIGQGIHTKVAQVAAHTLGIPYNFITVTQSTTLVSPNNNLTGGSITSESVCAATKLACEKILERMKPVREKMPNASWVELCQTCFSHLIPLNETHTFTALDGKNYGVIGCACSEVEIDVLTGNTQITRVDIVEDTGQSMSPLIDVGQIEGAFMMGVGYWLIEKLDYDRQTGELLTNRSWNYRVPGAKDIPIDFRIKFLQNVNSDGILRSKTTGEQALCLASSVPFALRHAIDSIRADNGIAEKWFRMGSGLTPDVVFESFGANVDNFKLK